MVEEKIKIKCTRCSQIFRERARRVRNGFQTNCPSCNRLITFDGTSEDRNVRRALASARDLRLELDAQAKASAAAAPGGVTYDRS